ncbi:MAG: nucleotidyltransferase domain-containing protein [Candidatus Bipolaricaulis sp.]|nr:nucleotidyltransferase domain-containing protein [Candidatus Bipolaricaulis sp.]
MLTLFLTHPDCDFYGREVGRLTGLLPRAVQRELDRLSGIGILEREKRGNRVYLRVNRANPIVPDLRAMVLKTVAVGDRIRETLTGREDIRVAFIFGSTAANADTAESDIDLFILGETPLSALSPTLSELERSLGREINVSLYSPGEVARRVKSRDPFLASVLAGPRIVLIGTEDDLRGMLT